MPIFVSVKSMYEKLDKLATHDLIVTKLTFPIGLGAHPEVTCVAHSVLRVQKYLTADSIGPRNGLLSHDLQDVIQNLYYHTTKYTMYSPATLLAFSLAAASASCTLLLPSSSCCLTVARLELRALSSILCCWSSLAFFSRKDCSALCPDACLSEPTSVVLV